jgi:hypothetical protein
MTNQQDLANQIFDELARLEVTSDQEFYSGLNVEPQSLKLEGRPKVSIVRIFDDYSSVLYKAIKPYMV